MIRSIFTVTLIALVAAPSGMARAEGLIVQLPKEGAWAQFEMVQVKGLMDKNSGKILIEDRTTQATLRISSVGSATVEKKSCRWIELKLEEPMGDAVKTTILKLLTRIRALSCELESASELRIRREVQVPWFREGVRRQLFVPWTNTRRTDFAHNQFFGGRATD